MISFRYQAQDYTLAAGDCWTAPVAADTYQDIPDQELAALVRELQAGTPWRAAVAQRYAQTNPWMHQIATSPTRDLFFRENPPPAGAHLLDIGAGWGQLALPLARQYEVTAVEPAPERMAFLWAAAAQEGVRSRLHGVRADFLQLEWATRFDLACCIGVLEWVPQFAPGDPRTVQREFLRRIQNCLQPTGQLVLGIENRLGLKYLLGAPDDHFGEAGIAVYDAALATEKYRAATGRELRCFTYTRAELADLLAEAGFDHLQFFAAWPDYKLPQRILPCGGAVDAFLAGAEHIEEHDGATGRRLENQAELRSHYRALARLQCASDFAPSYYVVARPVTRTPALRPVPTPAGGPALAADLEPAHIVATLRTAHYLPVRGDIQLVPLPRNPLRRDFLTRATYRVDVAGQPFCHLTIGRKLGDLWSRHRAFAQACPQLTCQPFFYHATPDWDYLGTAYFAGETLETLVGSGRLSATAARGYADLARQQLAGTLRPSTPTAQQQELEQLLAAAAASPLFAGPDQRFLHDRIFPLIRTGCQPLAPQRRWTNGDFVARNLLVDAAGTVRLVDCEFARDTHFHTEDDWRWATFSTLPEAARTAPAGQPATTAGDGLEALFVLHQMVLTHEVHGAAIGLADTRRWGARLVALSGGVPAGFHSQIFAPGAPPPTEDPVAQWFWSDEGTFTEARSQRFPYRPGEPNVIRLALSATAKPLHLRFDPADAPGEIEIRRLIIRQRGADEAVLLALDAATGWTRLQPGPGVEILATRPALVLRSTGRDPSLLLAPLELRDAVTELECAVTLLFRPAATLPA